MLVEVVVEQVTTILLLEDLEVLVEVVQAVADQEDLIAMQE